MVKLLILIMSLIYYSTLFPILIVLNLLIQPMLFFCNNKDFRDVIISFIFIMIWPVMLMTNPEGFMSSLTTEANKSS